MVRLQKGGEWKNSEDEVLKAAVMKYGMNNWSRVASLLNRKTARQCRARWYEWINPAVKKIAWSQGEDEKLLYAVKVFPTQWKTVAPIVGRTAYQCLNRYCELLSIAAGKGVAEERQLRPGEIDPNPETRPAKVDAVDLDEDEKEMLAEARARLANTKGKKAKRKAREKQLETRKQTVLIQRRKELEEAGIPLRPRRGDRRHGAMDYAHEIPFESAPKLGLYDTAAEQQLPGDRVAAIKRVQQLEAARAKLASQRVRLQEKRLIKQLHQHKAAAGGTEDAEEIPALFSQKQRTAIVLTAPVTSDRELRKVADLLQKQSRQDSLLSASLAGTAGTGQLVGSATQLSTALGHTRALYLPPTKKARYDEMTTAIHGGQRPANKSSLGDDHHAKGTNRRTSSLSTHQRSVAGGSELALPILDEGGAAASATGTAKKRPMVKRKKDLESDLRELFGNMKLTLAKKYEFEFDADLRSEDEDEDAGDMEDVKDLREIELARTRRRERHLERLGRIHQRVQIFAELQPRPLTIPSLEKYTIPIAPPQTSDRYRLQARRALLEEAQILYAEDEKFLPGETYATLFEQLDPEAVLEDIQHAFLLNAHKQCAIGSRYLLRAVTDLDEELMTQTSPEHTSMDEAAFLQVLAETLPSLPLQPPPQEEPTNTVFRICVEDPVSHIFGFVHGPWVEMAQDPRILESVAKRTRLMETHTQSLIRKNNKAAGQLDKLTGGYIAKEANALDTLDQMYTHELNLHWTTHVPDLPPSQGGGVSPALMIAPDLGERPQLMIASG